MTILFLHGWNSVPGGVKPTYLTDHGHTVINPHLPDEDFDEAVRIAQDEFDQHHPDVVIGSSRGGAVAMNIKSGEARLVLLCPAWKRWGKATTVKKNTMVLHSRADDVIPFVESEELVRNSGLPTLTLIEVGCDHRLANPESLEAMLKACIDSRPKVAGCDFGVPRAAGDQARKIIFIEAIRLGDRRYGVEPSGRNARLIHEFGKNNPWRKNRRGWTLPELTHSLSRDRSIHTTSFDFPFSIPISLLNDADFAQRMNQKPFGSREQWSKFVSSHLRLEFGSELAGAELEDLGFFDPWRCKAFWQQRSTDKATKGSPPLKHKFQNVFAMTLAGNAMLSHLSSQGYSTVLDSTGTQAGQCVFETYPRAVANRIGFSGSYKTDAESCLNKAVDYLREQGISLDLNERVRDFCLQYRTSGNDPDGADAFLCLVAAIAYHESMAEICDGGANAVTLREEGAIIVPRRSVVS